ncbi:MAG: DNA polymerase III subunit alpha [Rhodobacteraceae bacterium]|nr:DNA polymerase III subunit alpha [Paracoccaceae bacterium]
MSDPTFVHLRVHTACSLLEGAIHVKELPGLVEKKGMPAVAVTDTGNMFAALEFSEVAAKAGIQPIIGCQVHLGYAAARHSGARSPMPKPVVLLARDETGYMNLMKLNSCAFLDSGDQLPHVTMDELARHSGGLICLTGGAEGPPGQLVQDGQVPAAHALLKQLAALYPDCLYVEIQRHPHENGRRSPAEQATERFFVEAAYDLGLPLVATNDVYFTEPDMYDAHDALICIAEGTYVDQQTPRRRLTPEHYLKTPGQMAKLFDDLPEAIGNTIEVARRCAFRVTTREPILPKFADDEVEELRRQANQGLKDRLAVIPHAASVEDYQARLDFELKTIEEMGFPGYFLIVADFIKWAKKNDIPVGPGRGSGAGSLVAYALTITDLDPLRYSLLFERFLNPERVSMPDFDIDFCMERREEVIHYVQKKYGRNKVAQIITFGALLSKAAVRDVGRVLQVPYSQVDRLSKLIPMEGVRPMSIGKARIEEPRLQEEAKSEEVVARLLDYAQQLEGLYRNASTHAAGLVIGDRALDELVPLYQDPRSDMPATQFSMKWVEQAGLVKFDFLGLKTLTAIRNAVDMINLTRPLHIAADGTQLYGPPEGAANQINAIPLDDKKSYDLYASARTVAVFQVESPGMMDALRRMNPDTIEDIIALVALYRPGPMESIPKFCEVKNGISKRESIHPAIDHILDETQGIIVYQEQVMQIARVMAGYSLGGADLLRRAMGKKIQEAMDAERPKFLEGARKNGVDEKKALEVWNLLDKFANYGFNKSHAAAYAVVSYQTAWLKANHPVEFMAAVMNCDIRLTEKLGVFFDESRRMKIEIIPPCVNRSEATFSVDAGRIHYALGALKNVGIEAMRLISEARKAGTFQDLFDFARRVDLKRVGKRSMEILARAGAFDQLDGNRRKCMESVDQLIGYSAASFEQKTSTQAGLFGDSGDDLPAPRLPMPEDWLPAERLAEEHHVIGFHLSGHPLDDYLGPLKRQKVLTLTELEQKVQGGGPVIARIAGSVIGKRERRSGRGNRYAFVQLSDPTGLYEVTVFSDTLEKCRDRLTPGQGVVLTVEATLESDQMKLCARGAQSVDAAVAGTASAGLKIYLGELQAVSSVATRLEDAGKGADNRTGGPVHLVLMHPELPGEVEIALPETYAITPRIKGVLKHVSGVRMVEEF